MTETNFQDVKKSNWWVAKNADGTSVRIKPFRQNLPHVDFGRFSLPASAIAKKTWGKKSLILQIKNYFISVPQKFVTASKYYPGYFEVMISQHLKYYRYNVLPRGNAHDFYIEKQKRYGYSFHLDLKQTHQYFVSLEALKQLSEQVKQEKIDNMIRIKKLIEDAAVLTADKYNIIEEETCVIKNNGGSGDAPPPKKAYCKNLVTYATVGPFTDEQWKERLSTGIDAENLSVEEIIKKLK